MALLTLSILPKEESLYHSPKKQLNVNPKNDFMKKLLLITTAMFLLAAISFGQISAIPRTAKAPQRAQAKTSLGTFQQHNANPTIKKASQNNNPLVNPEPPRSPEAWITPWTFVQASGTYTAISGGTSIGATTDDEQVYGPYTIPFNFPYNGNVYTQFSVATNGFIGLGGTVVTTSSTPISTGTSNNIISALGENLAGQTGSDLQYAILGSSPNRTLVVQWTNYRKSAATGDVFNFQIRLSETTGVIAFVYNAFTVNSTNSTAEVGLRGASTADYNNRAVTTGTWAASTAGTTLAASCRVRTATKPANGQTYTWTPTICNTINTFPYLEDFSATFNACWSNTQVSGTGLWAISSSIAYTDFGVSLNPYSGTYAALFDSYNFASGTVARLAMSTFDFTALSSPELTFYMTQDALYSMADKIQVQVSTNGGSTWTTLPATYYRYNTAFAAPGWLKFTAFLTAYANTANVKLAFLATSAYGNPMAIDYVTVDQYTGPTNDVGPIALLNPTIIPTSQNLPWFAAIQNFVPPTQPSFPVATTLRENTVFSSTATSTVTNLAPGGSTILNGSFNLSSLGTGSSFDLAVQTQLGTDGNTLNDLLTGYTKPCTRGTVYAWDDGIDDGAVGFGTATGTGWFGQLYYLSSAASLSSLQIMWGSYPAAMTGVSLEIWNVAAGVPTTKFADIATGISLKLIDQGMWKTYDAAAPIALPAGTYWIGAHQSVGMIESYLLSDDQTGYTPVNYMAGHCFYSTNGTAWTDYTSSGLTMFNMIRPDFATVVVANPGNVTATSVSASEIDLAWLLNGNSNNVLVAFSTDGVFGTPVNGHVYSATDPIVGGGTVLQYSNALTFHHTGLSDGTAYFYKVWSYNGTQYSTGVFTYEVTQCNPVTVITEGFEDAFPPLCWTNLNAGSGNYWAVTPSTDYPHHSGDYCMYYAVEPTATYAANAWMFTKAFHMEAGGVYKVSFWENAYNASYPEKLKVTVGTAATVAAQTTTLYTGASLVNTAWAQQSASYTCPTTGTYYFAFNCYSAKNEAYLFIDDISIVRTYAHDIAVTSLDPKQVYALGTVTPVATVTNNGLNTETNFPVTMTIGSYTSTKTVATLASGASLQISFDPWANSVGDYTMQVCSHLTGDLNTGNDCMSHAVKVLSSLNINAYAYNTYPGTGSDPIGPTAFNLATPGVLNSIADQSTLDYPTGGTWANGQWYCALDNANSTTPYYLITMDPATGARTIIGDMGVSVTGLSYNTVNKTMYAIAFDGAVSKLYTINLGTGASTSVGTCGPDLLINLAINAAGQAFSVDISTDVLSSVNLTTGALTPIGPIGFNASYAQDMDFNHATGDLFIAAQDMTSGWLGWVNTTTGAVLKIGDFEGGAEITGFAIPYVSTKTLNLSATLLEGLYNGYGTMFEAKDVTYDGLGNITGVVEKWGVGVADHISVELHAATTHYDAGCDCQVSDYPTVVYPATDVPLSTTGTATVAIPGDYNSSYYLTIKQRNHIETVSALPVDFSGTTISYAFDAATKALDANMTTVLEADGETVSPPMIFGGDVNQDGQVEAEDMNEVGNDASAFVYGYVPTDVVGDGQVESGDINITGNNAANFVYTHRPM